MAKNKDLRQLGEKKIENSDLAGIEKELREVSDRSAAIVLASMVQRELEQLIVQVLPRRDEKTIEKLQERDGALNSFFRMIHLGYALGLYDDKTRDDLDTIRHIRNAFAHTPQAISFETEEVLKAVEGLPGPISEESRFKNLSKPRLRYMAACGRFIAAAQFKPIGRTLEMIATFIKVAQPHLSEDQKRQLPPDAVETFSRAAEAFKTLEQRLLSNQSPTS